MPSSLVMRGRLSSSHFLMANGYECWTLWTAAALLERIHSLGYPWLQSFLHPIHTLHIQQMLRTLGAIDTRSSEAVRPKAWEGPKLRRCQGEKVGSWRCSPIFTSASQGTCAWEEAPDFVSHLSACQKFLDASPEELVQ